MTLLPKQYIKNLFSITPSIQFKRDAQERKMPERGQKANENEGQGKEGATDTD